MIKKYSDILIALLISFVASIPLIFPYFYQGFFPTHDGEWAVVRLGDMFRSLRDFQFPVRFSGNLNFGYGYPLFNFAYPFPYYLGVLLHFLGIGFVDTIKLLFALSVPLSAFFMFFVSKEIWKKTFSAIVSSILYIYYPYRMIDLYVRGSLGESLSFVVFPLVLFLFLKILNSNNKIVPISLAGICYAVLIMTHNIMAVLFTLFLCAFLLFTYLQKNKKIIYCVYSLLLGLLISAFFWIPAIFEKKYILLSQIPIADRNLYFVRLDQLLSPKFGYGPPTSNDGFGYFLGYSQILIYIFSLLFIGYLILKKSKEKKELNFSIFLSICVFFAALCMFSFSSYVWKLPLLSEINYPWTLLGPLGFLISLLAGFVSIQKNGKYISFVIILVAVLTALPFAKPKEFSNNGDQYYLTNEATTTSSNELMPLWVKNHPIHRAEKKIEIIDGEGTIRDLSYKSNKFDITGDFDTDSIVRVNTLYYPGWGVLVNNQQTEVQYDNEMGVMDITVSRGSNEISGIFHETLLRMISNSVSLLAVCIVLGLLIKGILYKITGRKV